MNLRSLAACEMAVKLFAEVCSDCVIPSPGMWRGIVHGVSVVFVCYVRRSTCIQFASGSRCM